VRLEGDITMLKKILLFLLIGCCLVTGKNASAEIEKLTDLDEFVTQVMVTSGTPGLSISVVRGDEVVIARGYGEREKGKNEPVDENTLFAIGSNSKYFTATVLGLLVNEGKLSWDEPLTRYLPRLRFSDPYLFTELTLRDALSHRTGLQRGDWAWYANPGISRDEVLAMIENLPLEQSFRYGYLYNNFMFLAAGQTIPEVSGMSWDEFLEKRIFEPLQMNRSNTSTSDLSSMDNVATPHTLANGKAIPIAYYNIDHIAPAGSINSSVFEMAQWCRVQLGNGKLDGQELIPEAVINEVRKPHNLVPLSDKGHVRTIHGAYGLGIARANYGPDQVAYFHTGGIDGMLSSFAFIPESQLCVVVLTNSATNYGLNNAVLSWVLDHELGLDDRDYLAEFNEELKRQKSDEVKIKQQHADEHDPSTRYSLSLEEYAGTYSHDIYGDFVIDYFNEEIRFSYGRLFQGRLSHHQYDSFDLEHDEIARNFSTPGVLGFALNSAGEVESVLLEVVGEEAIEIRFVIVNEDLK
jgi:CubicO group peptidase (beta-lactamase class C family)